MKIYRTVSTLTNWEEREVKGDPKAAIGKEYRQGSVEGYRARLTENARAFYRNDNQLMLVIPLILAWVRPL